VTTRQTTPSRSTPGESLSNDATGREINTDKEKSNNNPTTYRSKEGSSAGGEEYNIDNFKESYISKRSYIKEVAATLTNTDREQQKSSNSPATYRSKEESSVGGGENNIDNIKESYISKRSYIKEAAASLTNTDRER